MVTLAKPRGRATGARGDWVTRGSLAAIVAVLILRLPGIVEPMGPDQGVYATIGWGLQRGLSLYRDLWELKPPGIYWTYRLAFLAFGTNEAAIFWVDYLAALITGLLVFDVGRRVVSLRFGALAAAAFALGTLPAARHAYGGFLERAISEKFISMLAAAAAWAAVMAVVRNRDRWSLAAGLFVGAAAVYKPFALAYLPALIVWVWWVTDMAAARRFAVRSICAVVVVPLAAVAWMARAGVLPDAWVALVEFNRAYLAVGDHGLLFILDRFAHLVWLRMKTDEVWALGSAGAFIALCAWRWRATRPGWIASLGILWLGAASIAIPANGPRMFMTYFLPSLVPLCLLAAWLLDQTLLSARSGRLVPRLLVLGLLALMLVRSGSVQRAADITAWDARHLAGQIGRQDYLLRFQARDGLAFSAASNERLATYLAAHTSPADRIFVFGMTGGTYFSTRRLPASRFVFVYPAVSRMIDRPEFRVETLAAELARHNARYIVLQQHNRDSFSGWKAMESFAAPAMVTLLRDYQRETEIGDFVLYRRRS